MWAFSQIKVDHIGTAISSLSLTISAEFTSSRTNRDKIKVTKEVTGVQALKKISSFLHSKRSNCSNEYRHHH